MGLALIYISLVALMLYAGFGIFIFMGFYIPVTKKKETTEQPFISIVIPFRNEEKNLTALIKSIQALHYPHHLFEIIFANDHSTDNGCKIIEACTLQNYQLINTAGQGKKAAITEAMDTAKGTIIAATDADCILPTHWLSEISKASENAMLLGPVQLAPVKNALHFFQEMEWAALQSISASTAHWKIPMMSNGANLAYKKAAFESSALKSETASGDDIFLLEDFKRKKQSIQFLWNENSIVKTMPVSNFKQLIQQKVRWASKSKLNTNHLNTALGVFIACINVLVIVNTLNLLSWNSSSQFSIMVIISKIIVDLTIMLPYLILIKKPQLVLMLPFFIFIYPWYFIYVLILSVSGKFTWKEREYRV